MYHELKVLDDEATWDATTLPARVQALHGKFVQRLSDTEKNILRMSASLPVKFSYHLTPLEMTQVSHIRNVDRTKYKRASETDTIGECLEAGLLALQYGAKACMATQAPPTTLQEVGVKGCIVVMAAKVVPGMRHTHTLSLSFSLFCTQFR